MVIGIITKPLTAAYAWAKGSVDVRLENYALKRKLSVAYERISLLEAEAKKASSEIERLSKEADAARTGLNRRPLDTSRLTRGVV
jgi:hypothetical protein